MILTFGELIRRLAPGEPPRILLNTTLYAHFSVANKNLYKKKKSRSSIIILINSLLNVLYPEKKNRIIRVSYTINEEVFRNTFCLSRFE